jgi:hypothetical protein
MRERLRKSALKQVREGFFNTIDTIEIDLQLQGLSVNDGFKIEDTDEVLQGKSSIGTKSLCGWSRRDSRPSGVPLIKDWAALCSLQSGSSMRKISCCDFYKPKSVNPDETSLADTFPFICPPTLCLFCLGNDQRGPLKSRAAIFSRPDRPFETG